MSIHVNYQGDGTGNGRSRSVWADFDETHPDKFHLVPEHFMNVGDQASTTIVDGWYSYLDSTCTAVVLDDTANGIMDMATHITGDVSCQLQWGSDHAPFAAIATAGSEKRFWYEARVATSLVSSQTVYVGLADGGIPADGMLKDDGTGLNGKDFIGFRILEADSDGWDAVYRTTTTEVVLTEEAQVGVATTYYKFGITYEPLPNQDWVLRYWVNGVSVGKIGISETSVPDGVYMAPYFGIKDHAGAVKHLYADAVDIGIEL